MKFLDLPTALTFAVLAVTAVFRSPALCTDDLPSATLLCDQAEAKIGDRERIQSIRNIVYKGTSTLQGMGDMKGTFTEIVAKPMLASTITKFPGMGEMSEGTDGNTFWETNPQGTFVHTAVPKELKKMGYSAALLSPWRKVYQEAKTVGVEDVNERTCYKIELTSKGGATEVLFLDRDTLLTAKLELTYVDPKNGNETPIEILLEGWKKVSGIYHSHKRTIKVMMMEIVMDYQSIEYDVDLPENTFALPDAVKQKLAEKAVPKDDSGG